MKFINQTRWAVSSLLAIALSTPAFAAPAVQHIFSNGQPADANQVNENFQELADRIDAVPAGPQGPAGAGVVQINFDPYRHNFASKTFRVTGDNELGESGWFWQEVRTFDRMTPGTVIETRELTDSVGATQGYRKFYFTTGLGQDKILTKREIYDNADTSVLDNSSDYDPGLTFIKNSMIVGHQWSTHSINNSVDPQLPAQFQNHIGGAVETRVLIEQESTTANNVVYSNCLKVLDINTTGQALLWYCEGMGLVKIVSTPGSMRELVSTTP
ncbi:hypothetical protein [Kaarinaea lacus]